MLGKIVNGQLIYPPHRIVLNGMQIFNPTDDQLTQVGYKPITETPMPEEPAPEGQHYESKYTDAGDTITQSWVLVEDEETLETDKTIIERISTLEQDISSINSVLAETQQLILEV